MNTPNPPSPSMRLLVGVTYCHVYKDGARDESAPPAFAVSIVDADTFQPLSDTADMVFDDPGEALAYAIDTLDIHYEWGFYKTTWRDLTGDDRIV